jgi:2-amino-4-hydroxy-6-hydroxymethyldihydropteridine diphosphokinase
VKAVDAGHSVYISLGSNVDRHKHIGSALDALNERYMLLAISTVYESASVGFVGDPFFNLVVQLETRESLAQLGSALRKIEGENGRTRGEAKFSNRTLDIDILLYDDRVGIFEGMRLPRPEITENAYVLWPLAEIAEDLTLPGSDSPMADLWAAFEKSTQKLSPISFSWRGNNLPLVGSAHLVNQNL